MGFVYKYLVYLQGKRFTGVEILQIGVGALAWVLSQGVDNQGFEYTRDIHKSYISSKKATPGYIYGY